MQQNDPRKSWAGLMLFLLLASALNATGTVRAAGEQRLRCAADARDLAHPALGTLPYEEARVYFVAEDGTVLKTAAVTQRLRHGVYYIPWELAFGDRTPAGTRRIYLVHNHPGGNPALSESDIRLGSFWAARAAEEGIALDLLAITPSGDYTSLHESGQLRPVPKGLATALDYAGYVLAPGVQMAGSRLMEAARTLVR
ncbi:MAG: JAB domain-containing protein [Bacillota bacterium]|nr:JAB domain-containing protein [Bacillota bacterium]